MFFHSFDSLEIDKVASQKRSEVEGGKQIKLRMKNLLYLDILFKDDENRNYSKK